MTVFFFLLLNILVCALFDYIIYYINGGIKMIVFYIDRIVLME